MAEYRPLTTPNDLPKVNDAFETATLDMKEAIKPKATGTGKPKYDLFELAKDVAMFASSIGGTILVGAEEDGRTGRLKAYHPMLTSDAKALADTFDDAVKARCHPSVMIDPSIIAQGTGVVLAVNVPPFPGQPVAVHARGDATDGYGDQMYAWPVRVGRDCAFIPPEQLPMLMLPELRHAAIRLKQIPTRPPAVVGQLRSIAGGTTQFTDLKINEAGSTVKFTMANQTELDIPLDFIGPVWRSALGPWVVQLIGQLVGGSASIGDVYQFDPLMTVRR
jgi:hypothetical protein